MASLALESSPGILEKLMFGIVLAAPTVMVPLFNSWMIVVVDLAVGSPYIEVACMMRR